MGCRCCGCRRSASIEKKDETDEGEQTETPRFSSVADTRPGEQTETASRRCRCCCTTRGGTTRKNAIQQAPKAPKERSAAAGKNEVLGESTKITMYVRCERLKKKCPYFVVAYTKLLEETDWCEVEKSEMSESSQYPNFPTKFAIVSRVYTRPMVRFELYRCRTENLNDGLEEQSFIGGAEVEVLETVMARKTGDGWCTRPLQSKRSSFQGSLAIWAEEDVTMKSEVRFILRGAGLKKTDAWKRKADPFALIYRCDALDYDPEGQRASALKRYEGKVARHLVFHTQVKRRTGKPEWILKTSAPALADVSSSQHLVIEMWDWFRMTDPRMIGLCTTCLDDLHTNFITGNQIRLRLNELRPDRIMEQEEVAGADDMMDLSDMQPIKKSRGEVTIDEFTLSRAYTFYDFLRSGCEVVPIFAVDFTRSTGLRDAGRADGMHPLHQLEGERNDYATTLQVLGTLFEGMSETKKIPAYGFGAKVPPTSSVVSHAFALNGDFFAPEVDGVEGLLSMYKSSLKINRLHGPTLLQPIVDVAASWAQSFAEVETEGHNGVEMKYFVLVIITDGDVQDQSLAVQSLVECTTLPISVIIVAVGHDENAFLQDIHKEVRANQEQQKLGERDFIRFVRFDDYRDRPDRLARKAMKDLPHDLASYFKAINVKPRNLAKFEDSKGTPLPRPSVRCESDLKPKVGKVHDKDLVGHKEAPKVHLFKIDEILSEYEKQLIRRPQFLRDRYVEFLQEIEELGYPESVGKGVLKEGVADDSLDLFIDNLLHAGYGNGKVPTYKMAIEQAQKREHSTLVKSVTHKVDFEIDTVSETRSDVEMRLRKKKSLTSIQEVDNSLTLPGAVESIETQIVRSTTPANLQKCTICLENKINVEFVPCGHRLACDKCTDKIGDTCPWCQAPLRGRKKI